METATYHIAVGKQVAKAARTFPTLPELIADEKTHAQRFSPQQELTEKQKQGAPPTFPALDRETRAAVETACAAFHLNRQPQTLRAWASAESGPLRPIRCHGRLMWPTAKLRELCGVPA